MSPLTLKTYCLEVKITYNKNINLKPLKKLWKNKTVKRRDTEKKIRGWKFLLQQERTTLLLCLIKNFKLHNFGNKKDI